MPGSPHSHPGADARLGMAHAFAQAVQIANDLIDFDGNAAYLVWPDGNELVWSYAGGGHLFSSDRLVAGNPKFEADAIRRLERNRGWHQTLSSLQPFTTPDLDTNVPLESVLARVDGICGAEGFLAIARQGLGNGAVVSFSDADRQLLGMIGVVVSAALGGGTGSPGDSANELLTKLDLHRLHLHRRMQDMPLPKLLEQYLFKAAELCHDLTPQAFERTQVPAASDRVRLTAKLVNSNGAELHIASCLSTHPGEWTEQQRRRRYPLYGPDAERSLAARAYQDRRPYSTDRYQDVAPAQYQLFPDTKCHISVPILRCGTLGAGDANENEYATNASVLGVISVGTTATEFVYHPVLQACLGILAAHAAVPIRHAMTREDRKRMLDVITEELTEPATERSERVIKDKLVSRLNKLGYSVRFDSAEAGWIEVPLLNHRGETVWTVRARQLAGAELREFDLARVRTFGGRAARDWSNSELREAEGAILHELARPRPAYHLDDLLTHVTELITGTVKGRSFRRVVARAAAWVLLDDQTATVGSPWRLVHQVGSKVEEGSPPLDTQPEGGGEGLHKPALYVGADTDTAVKSCDDFDVRRPPPGPTGSTRQFAVIPVYERDVLVAKLRVEHAPPSTPAGNDSFTEAEMLFLARLSRTLSFHVGVAKAQRVIAKLCAVGSHAGLMEHAMRRFATVDLPLPQSGLAGIFLNTFDSYKPGCPPTSVGQAIEHVRNVFGFVKDSAGVGDADLEIHSHDATESFVSHACGTLVLILITLAENSCRHLKEELTGNRKVRITLRKESPDSLFAEVEDRGKGVSEDEQDKVLRRLCRPLHELEADGVHGLTVASILAQAEGGKLELVECRKPTRFRLTLPNFFRDRGANP